MTNPYHDASGRFASREGMVSSIDHLAQNGYTEAYLILKTELGQIDSANSKKAILDSHKKATNTTRNAIAKKINDDITSGNLNHYYSPKVSVGAKTITVLLDGITNKERVANEATVEQDIAKVAAIAEAYPSIEPKTAIVKVLTDSERQGQLDKLNRTARKEQFEKAPRFQSTNGRRVKVNSLQPGMVISDTEKVYKVYRDSKTPKGKYSVAILNVLNEINVKHWNSSTEIGVGDSI